MTKELAKGGLQKNKPKNSYRVSNDVLTGQLRERVVGHTPIGRPITSIFLPGVLKKS